MMTPTLIGGIDQDLADGHAAVVQIVSTGEALMERRLAEIPTEEWSDLHVDITPREYVLGYLAALLPDAALRGVFGRRGQRLFAPALRGRQSGPVPGGRASGATS